MPGPCPSTERLAAVLRGTQPSGDDANLVAHLTDCSTCQAKLETLAGGSGWVEAKARTHAANAGSASEPLQQAMRRLETRSGASEHETVLPPRLDFLQPSDQPGVLGRFGPHEVIAHIASGGMGIVLRARDPALDRIVALKILQPTLAANSLARARFVREARAAAAVVHEHVVPIYAVAEFASLPYLVMQFVEGRSLAERIRDSSPLRLEEILRVGAQTAAGLAAAHAQGLVHRDVKPGNILLENSVERVKLTDFGLARAVEDVSLTRTGELAGTPEFMAPEQAGNEPVDHRADLFSLGSVMYAMCTGHSPFRGSTVVAVIRKVCDAQPPPVREISPNLPHWLSDIVVRLMAKTPAERFQSAKEVSALLERYLARVQHGELGELPGISTRAAATARTRRRIAIGAATSLAVAAVLVFTLKDRRGISSNSSPSTSLQEQTEPSPSDSLQEPFVVKTEAGASVGAFARIEGALATAPPGAIIELCWSGPRSIDPITLPPTPLTLRAGRGFQPVWRSLNSASALSASAALTLEGIRFEMTSRAGRTPLPNVGPRRPRIPPSGVALLSITNGPLRITHCAFEGQAGIAAPEQAGIFLADVLACRVENTLLFMASAKAIVWQKPSSGNTGLALLTITNCITYATETFWLDLRETARARLEIARCSFHGPMTFCIPPSLAATNLEVNARRTVFHTGAIILDARNPAWPPPLQWLQWREQENLHKPRQGPEQRYITGVAVRDGPYTLEDWNRWWNQTGANSRVVQLTFASGVSDLKPGSGFFRADPDGYRITDLRVVEGSPLERDQWKLFGADTANVGPRLVKSERGPTAALYLSHPSHNMRRMGTSHLPIPLRRAADKNFNIP